ncbi:SWPV1-161 [Shearwaterpox virus]|uniref:SWPV1-161 n=1 Tax=Shearwaterpox virus TaxID=1974596 RepID=A0A1V0S841_CNPV|nr:SWPV1-161 [Shearwaterpox virus]
MDNCVESVKSLSYDELINNPEIIFCQSCSRGDINTLETLLSAYPSLVNTYNEAEIMMPIHYAVKNNHLNVVEFLLDNGADTESYDGLTLIPLFYAVMNRNVDMVKLILRYSDDSQIEDYDLIKLAIQNRDKPVLKELLLAQDEYWSYENMEVVTELNDVDSSLILSEFYLTYYKANKNSFLSNIKHRIEKILNHVSYTYDCLSRETIIAIILMYFIEVKEKLNDISNINIGRYLLGDFINKCMYEITIMSNTNINNSGISLLYVLKNKNNYRCLLVRKAKYLYNISNRFNIYGHIIKRILHEYLDIYNKIYRDIYSLGDMLPLEIRYIILERAYLTD